ncbi:histidine phosphatase [Grosmannia clavigera kw1407]|uniref:Histidine phosphatase n=1 Tax=Grosmannia clavigera (strain kw1407 / UAMH 11150) TaxID=655863 RepID=F0X782_GROCL|nr:histidine phosphatase [Grosmannia clavigera kw1407]EFX06705.1 histidine phosphatase [Grosmannia clavigera kw1407]
MKVETMAMMAALATSALGSSPVTDYNVYSRYWGQLSPYASNADDLFGVNDVGVPAGCGLEQAHLLQRHAQRFGTGEFDDAPNDATFGDRVASWQARRAKSTRNSSCSAFSGPLAFLNQYSYTLSESVLTGIGATTEFSNGVAFWNRYGRLLYGAVPGQVAYNGSFTNGTARPKPVLRTTSQSRIRNSQISWSLGFFGPSFSATPNPMLDGWTDAFDVVVITEGGTENNTLAAYDSCHDDTIEPVIDIGDQDLWGYLSIYLAAATKRLQPFAPAGFVLTVNDTYAMQSICAYETAYIGESPFCNLFTLDEWAGFENTLDIEYYYDYTYGNPTGRAQGIGYLQELLARLTNQLIYSSNSSINASLTNNEHDFPLGRPFYADFSHDDIIVSVLTAMSLDYFRDPPSLSQWPPNPNRAFVLSHLTPFGAHLVTEVYGCADADPTAVTAHQTLYKLSDTGYNASAAPHKFVRMRLNEGILPLNTVRGGACYGRTDGLCALDSFLESQANATAMANYQYACFGNWTLADPFSGADYDGTIFE